MGFKKKKKKSTKCFLLPLLILTLVHKTKLSWIIKCFFFSVIVLTAAILFFLFHLLEIFDRRSKPRYHLLQPDYSALPCCLSKGEKKKEA